jgi:uncharacterized protein YbjT (DUF2867 family)
MKTAILLGASGLVGGHLLQQLLDSPHYGTVIALLRKPLPIQHPKLRQQLLDFERPDPAAIQGDDLFCALGTTLRKAGSEAAQRRIDHDYPLEIGRLAKANGVRQYLLVSSLGAGAPRNNFYLQTKGALEQGLEALGFAHFVAARPSLLLGERQEFRLGEQVGIWFARLFAPLIPRRYRAIQASKVARALIAAANDGSQGAQYLESERLQAF